MFDYYMSALGNKCQRVVNCCQVQWNVYFCWIYRCRSRPFYFAECARCARFRFTSVGFVLVVGNGSATCRLSGPAASASRFVHPACFGSPRGESHLLQGNKTKRKLERSAWVLRCRDIDRERKSVVCVFPYGFFGVAFCSVPVFVWKFDVAGIHTLAERKASRQWEPKEKRFANNNK